MFQIYEILTRAAGTIGPVVFNLKGVMMNVIAPFSPADPPHA
jgi:hypothetical protein